VPELKVKFNAGTETVHGVLCTVAVMPAYRVITWLRRRRTVKN